MIAEECREFRPTLWQRVLWRFFPHPPRPLDDNDRRTYLTTEVHITVNWGDRLRLLLTGRARVMVITYTDVEIKDASSRSVFWVELWE